uniref:Core Histone H2A/H2B/H3 domain-containing protein n=1 Tax=Glossina morsitans morsitans TaxID=37546 RepID=A0A1B0G7N6_GLOMM
MGSRASLGDSDIYSDDEEPTVLTLRLRPKKTNNSATNETQSQVKKTEQSRRKKTAPTRRDVGFLREVRRLQMTTDFMIPRLPFSRLVREIVAQHSTIVWQMTATALEALQMAAEMYVGQRLQDAYMLTLHRKCVTLQVKDMKLINILRID